MYYIAFKIHKKNVIFLKWILYVLLFFHFVYGVEQLTDIQTSQNQNSATLFYDSKEQQVLPTFSDTKKEDSKDIKQTMSESEKRENEKNLQTGVSKKDTDFSKLFELLGEEIEHYDNYMVVRGNAILKNKEAYIIADEIIYNPELKQARLMGNVRIYKGDTLSVIAKQATVYLNSDFSIIRPFYIQDTDTGIWTHAESASSQKSIYRFADSMVSGCSFVSPAWRIDSSKGAYDKEKNTLALWNPRIYIGDVPVFYLPYLKVSLENKRTSGILYPTLGSSSTDGFTYIQPYYVALQNFWDMTISPQVRTSRGAGANFEFRAIDSSNDKYMLHLKYFYNNDEYMQKLNLLNQHVYGFDFKHSKRNVIQKYFGAKTKLDNAMFFDLAFMNDIDYMRLDDVRYFLNQTSYISKANLYAQTDNHYFGLNLRYYLNLYTQNNSTTFQNLPNIQYHKYMGSLFVKELLYSLDYKMQYAYRDSGYSYLSNELSIPIGMQFSFLNKYFSIGAWLNVFAGNTYATNTKDTIIYTAPNTSIAMQENMGNYANLNYRISVNSDIGRRYGNFFHSMQTAVLFNAPVDRVVFTNGILSPEILKTYTQLPVGVLDAIQNGANIWNPQNFGNIYQMIRRLDLSMSNYIYNRNGAEIFYWKLSQSFNFDDTISPLRIPMENKFGTTPLPGLSLNLSLFYSWFYSNFTEIGVNASYTKGAYAASISYFLKRDDAAWSIDPTTLTYKPIDSSNYLSASLRGDLGYFGLVADLGYDFRTQNIVNMGVGVYKDIKCFGIGLKAGSNRTPMLSQGNTISVIDNIYVKAEFRFVPLTTFGYTYRLRPVIEQQNR